MTNSVQLIILSLPQIEKKNDVPVVSGNRTPNADLESASDTTAPHGMIANKFLGAVGLVQMHFIKRDCNLKRFVFYFRHIPLWKTNFQEIKFLSWMLCCLYPYIHFISI